MYQTPKFEPLFILVPKWLDALRSGRFRQAQAKLAANRDDGTLGHCCLGVLCEIAGFERTQSWVSGIGYQYRFDGEDQLLPQALVRHMEFVDSEGTFTLEPEFAAEDFEPDEWGQDEVVSLVSLNDGGASFDMIADKIEAYYQQKGILPVSCT